MRTTLRAALLCAVLAAGGAAAGDYGKGCGNEAAMRGMRERMQLMHEQMDRIEWTTDRTEQWKLLDLHAKHMREGMRELRVRDLGASCRMELMSSIMEEMVRHQLVLSERDAR
jgi:hypothetical protein